MIWKHDMILLSAKLFLELSSLTTSSVYSFTTMLGNSVSWGMCVQEYKEMMEEWNFQH